METVTFEFTDFCKIRAESAVSVDIVRSDAFRVAATEDDMGHLKVEKTGDTLKISRRALGLLTFFRDRPHVTVASPALDEIVFAGASKGKADGFQSERALLVKLSGASLLEMHNMACGGIRLDISGASNLVGDGITAGDAELLVSGASRVELSGSGTKARIELSSASQARLSRLVLNDANINISGASNAQLTLNGILEIAMSGASKLEYAGNPSLGDVQVTGASTLTRK